MTYAWIIDKDHIKNESEPEGTNCNAKGVCGPRGATEAEIESLKNGAGTKFRLFDDDNNLYYEGRLLGDPESEDGFGPLDDFGMPNAGCTYIEYKNANGKWEML